MNPIPAPAEAVAGRPECELVAMGPPQGVSGDDCGTAQMLVSPVEEVMPGYTARRQYAYFRPSPSELEQLRAGGFIETCQYGMGVQPFSAAVWPVASEPAPPPAPVLSDTAHCENDHGEPRWAVALLHLVDSMSAANVTALCQSCLGEWIEEFIDEQIHGTAEAWEIRPLAVGGCPAHDGTPGPHHDEACALWDANPPPAQAGPDLGRARVLAQVEQARQDTETVDRIAARVDADRALLQRLTDDPTDPRLTRGVDTAPTGQAEAYLVLSDEERAKGFVRPVRTAYVHAFWVDGRTDPLPAVVTPTTVGLGGCGALTTMNRTIAETYARDPKFYGATYCVGCSKHLPVSEFRWSADTGEVVGS